MGRMLTLSWLKHALLPRHCDRTKLQACGSNNVKFQQRGGHCVETGSRVACLRLKGAKHDGMLELSKP
ncbi:unnamed protein product [Tetraodon nigroviridis]|uniref:Chromosome 10 SCAF15019, whole genome shotgun sequence n=1 Tax=Tetraodon nigroviridis TaxID=99883 RepID=Q4RMI0_TETNG|nr:unnamed protein product [Tetraodon nigroviridis]